MALFVSFIFITKFGQFLAFSELPRFLREFIGIGVLSHKSNVQYEDTSEALDQIKKDLSELKVQSNTGLSTGTQEAVVEAVRDLVRDNIVSAATDTVSKTFNEKTSNFFSSKEIDKIAIELIELLISERRTAAIRSFMNLFFGIIISGYGVYLLSTVVQDLQIKSAEPVDTALNFAAKFSVVILVQVFGYFFLNLYRSGSQDMKYYQNEVTNVSAWRLSLRAAISTGDAAVIGGLSQRLASIERNFVLEKGQSTVDLKRESNLSEQDLAWLRALRELPSLKPNSSGTDQANRTQT